MFQARTLKRRIGVAGDNPPAYVADNARLEYGRAVAHKGRMEKIIALAVVAAIVVFAAVYALSAWKR
jgi:hypothetical protein